MTTDIFVKTYSGDSEYHKYCMASIEKFCTGFRATVVIDDGDTKPANPYVDQQRVKLNCDTYTDADFILITDSDTLFTQSVTPESFMRDGKPIWLHTPWTPEMLAHPGIATWKKVMMEFSGTEPHSEFMRRMPFMFPRHVLESIRQFCINQHGVSLDDYLKGRTTFSEFNVAGWHCWQYHRDDFYWLDTSKEALPELKLRQFWSRDPIAKNLDEIQRILA